MDASILEIRDIELAAERLDGLAVRTPLLEHPALNERIRGRALLKVESLQRVGAFKFRGAYNAVIQIDRTAFPGGVVACSSGNHAQGIAAAAALCEMPAVLVMPRDAPALKLDRTKSYGAEVVTYERASEDRFQIASDLAAERRAYVVHPFDDRHVMAGQGTVGLELMQQASALDAPLDAVLVCTAGGGLLSGIAVAAKAVQNTATVHSVEPVGFDDFARSLRAGKRVRNAARSGSVCDALLVDQPGELTFAIAQQLCSVGVVVTDSEAIEAMRYAFFELKLVLEPGGAVALAALLTGRFNAEGKIVAAVLSGGNVDPDQFANIIGNGD